MTKTARALGVALSFLVLPLGLAACGKPQAAAPAQQPRAVHVAVVQMRSMDAALASSGLLVSREEAAVSSELPGYRVAKVYVDIGAWVRAGQPMVQLDDTLLRSQIATQAVAVERAQKEAGRVSDLDGKGVLSQEDIDARRFAAASAQAQLADLKVRQSRMTIRAPVSGIVLERTVRPGDLSGGGTTPMFRIARDGLVELAAEAPEDQLNLIRPGALASVVLPDGARLTGRVRVVSPEVDQQTKLGVARVSLPVSRSLRPGGFAHAQFTDLQRPALVAPDKAVIFDADGAYVMTVDGSNRVHRVAVKTGARAGGMVELIQGPPAGSRVLTSGATFVLEGDLVRPTPEPKAAP